MNFVHILCVLIMRRVLVSEGGSSFRMLVLGDFKFVLLGLEVCGFRLKGGSAGLYEIEFGTELLLFEFDTLLQLPDACLYLLTLSSPLTDPSLLVSDLALYLPEQPPLDL